MSNFGALTDHFGLATSTLVLIDSNKNKVPKSRADAMDENGDVAATTFFGNAAGTLFDASCTYLLKSGTLALATAIKLGELAVGKVAENAEIVLSMGENPKITVSGKLGTPAITAPTGKKNTYVFPLALTIVGAKTAQIYGATVTQGKLNSCTISASVELGQQDDGVGEPAAFGLGNGVGEVSLDVVRNTATAPAITVASGFTETEAGLIEPQANYHNSPFKLEFTLTRENATP